MQIENKPGESSRLHIAVVSAFRAHWKAHGNKNPQKLVMNLAQDRAFAIYHGTPAVPKGQYFDTPLEVDPASPGVMIAIDGTVMPFADFDPAKPNEDAPAA